MSGVHPGGPYITYRGVVAAALPGTIYTAKNDFSQPYAINISNISAATQVVTVYFHCAGSGIDFQIGQWDLAIPPAAGNSVFVDMEPIGMQKGDEIRIVAAAADSVHALVHVAEYRSRLAS